MNIGAVIRPNSYSAVAVAFAPQTISGTSLVNGAATLRVPNGSSTDIYYGAQLIIVASGASGSPTAISLAASFQTDDGSGFASPTTLTLPDGSALSGTLTMSGSPIGGTDVETLAMDVPLLHAEEYVRLNITPTFTGGSSPDVIVAGMWVLPKGDRF